MLYEKIRKLCKEKGVTVTEVERELGFGRGSLSKIDKHKPSNEKIKALADYFGISQDELTGVQTDAPLVYYYDAETMKLAEALHKNKELRVLFDAAQDISSDDLYFVYGLVQRMKKNNRDE